MNITRGKIPGAKKVVIYGPEGIGKSTFASHFPEPLFIDTEGGTKELDVARTDKPATWEMLLSLVAEAAKTPGICRTLVIDTVDWAEQMCIQSVCRKHNKTGLESFGYGSGYVYVKEEFGRFLDRLSEVVDAGMNVVLTAHAQIRKFEQPDEMGAYDRWELKLGKKTSSQTSPLVKEWSDLLLFANYKTFSVAADEKGKRHKAQGGKRVMYTVHHPCWDAKNRYGLPDECPLDYEAIRHIIEPENTAGQAAEAKKKPEKAEANQPEAGAAEKSKLTELGNETQEELPINRPEPPAEGLVIDERIPKRLRELMLANNVCEWDIQAVVEARGYYSADVPVRDYPQDFTEKVLIDAWPQVYGMIKQMKEDMEVPFN